MTPFISSIPTVPPEWIDYNDHLMDGYYMVAFGHATDRFLETVGFGPAYPGRSGYSVYTVEGHINYLREVKPGARLRFETLLLGYDQKRLHLFHTMLNENGGYIAATNELMLLHVHQASGKTAAMPAESLALLATTRAAHAALPTPPQAGRRIAMPQ
ncbi:MAG: thioesterase family protein [Chloroflexaceae bacterium]|nr:thioesterase family protein [Chloroflexaceae bacterium]